MARYPTTFALWGCLAAVAGCNVIAGYSDLEPSSARGSSSGEGGNSAGGGLGASGGSGGSARYVVGGTVVGLDGTVTLEDGAEQLVVDEPGVFTFSTPLADGSDYGVTVAVQPAGEYCGVLDASGTLAGADAANVTVRCLDTQPTYMKASNTGADDEFGTVAIWGDTMVVGAPGERSLVPDDPLDDGAFRAGAAYVFERVDGTWQQQAYLKAAHPGGGDEFGISVAIHGDTIVVGARHEDSDARSVDGDDDNDNRPESGAAYVFVRDGSNWEQQAYLKASNADASDDFGSAVAVFENTVVVGAMRERSNASSVNGSASDNSSPNSGAAYVFVRTDGLWSERAYLKPSGNAPGNGFGVAVAADGGSLAVGAHHEDGTGAAYVFVGEGSQWTEKRVVAPNAGINDDFGLALDLEGDRLVVGARGESSSSSGIGGAGDDNLVLNSGAAYIFERSGSEWSPGLMLKASDTAGGDLFGSSVAIDGNTVVVGARGEASASVNVGGDQAGDSATNSGAAYVFMRASSQWEQLAYLKASNTGANDHFGRSAAAAGGVLVLGAYWEGSAETRVGGMGLDDDAPKSGAVYLFE